MARYITVTPYLTDYKSGKAAREAFVQGKDFILQDCMSKWDGKPCSISDFPSGTTINIRYKKMTQIVVHVIL